MGSEALHQFANQTPPRRGAVINLTLDATARAYDLTGLDFGGFIVGEKRVRQRCYLTLQAITADLFFYFQNDAIVTLDQTQTIAAGNALAYVGSHCWKLSAGQTLRVRIDRQDDRFLVAKGSAAGNLLITASSESFGD